jgi:hypothetical protein
LMSEGLGFAAMIGARGHDAGKMGDPRGQTCHRPGTQLC